MTYAPMSSHTDLISAEASHLGAEELFADLFDEDIYLAEHSEKLSVMAGRSRLRRLGDTGDLRDILEPDAQSRLSQYLVSSDELPMVLDTRRGAALIYRQIFPSSNVFLLCFPRGAEGAVAARADKSGSLIDAFLSASLPSSGDLAEVERGLTEISRLAARIAGAAASVKSAYPIGSTADIDLSLLKIFILNFLLLARRYSPERRADIIFESKYEGAALRLCFDCDVCREVYGSILAFSRIAERLSMIFSVFEKESGVELVFCPIRKDWSLLGLKSPLSFVWRSERGAADHPENTLGK